MSLVARLKAIQAHRVGTADADLLEEVLQDIARLTQQWLPIATAKQDGTEYLLCASSRKRVWIGSWNFGLAPDDGFIIESRGMGRYDRADYYMPMPLPHPPHKEQQ